MVPEIGGALALLTAAIEPDEWADVVVFEHWAKEPRWPALTAGLPLMLGVRPQAWARLLADVPAAAILQSAFAEALQWSPAGDEAAPPARLRAVAERMGITLPPLLAQLLDFLGRVLPPMEREATESVEAQVLAADERATLLGVALMLVTRFPSECVDEAGYYSPGLIADRILQKSARWFPLAPPTLDRDDIEALLAVWVNPGV